MNMLSNYSTRNSTNVTYKRTVCKQYMTKISILVQNVFLPFIHHSYTSKSFSVQITGTALDVVKQRQKKDITKTFRKHILIHLVARWVKNFANKHSQANKT